MFPAPEPFVALRSSFSTVLTTPANTSRSSALGVEEASTESGAIEHPGAGPALPQAFSPIIKREKIFNFTHHSTTPETASESSRFAHFVQGQGTQLSMGQHYLQTSDR
jgi:hypothetical protein